MENKGYFISEVGILNGDDQSDKLKICLLFLWGNMYDRIYRRLEVIMCEVLKVC